MPRSGEAGHVGADLGDDRLRGGAANAGDLIQPLHRRRERGDLGLDVAVQGGDVVAGLVDARKHGGQQEGVMVGELPGEGLLELAQLGAQPRAGQLRQPVGCRNPFTQLVGGTHGAGHRAGRAGALRAGSR